ncbi:MAG: cytochrome c oxidase accessory protein CcoG [Candidatus Dadabacteria bacterium]|nr:MAG: cytochrome c oxidase accessory protein CcoG [Candidatus Dadabacteria bacterium]
MNEPTYRDTLYTVDKRGNRRWVYCDIIKGKFYYWRAIVAYGLVVFYLALPWLGLVRLDFGERKFVFFGGVFWSDDTIFLALIFGGLAIALFFFTALIGRVWCGWACPETVFLEFVYRPIERLIEGNAAKRRKLDLQPWSLQKIAKKLLKHGLFAFVTWIIATSTLAYFTGPERVLEMITDWPWKNPIPFMWNIAILGVFAFQFGWFREQFCTVLCPYARFQSVLMDSHSLVVGYDSRRGEPRGKLRGRKKKDPAQGDCVDCGLCVRVCPTGIDIRNGIQLECISCCTCIDACDSIMDSIGKPRGLIRYSTEEGLSGNKVKILRPRVAVYGVLLFLFVGIFGYLLVHRELSEFQVLRGALDKPFEVLPDGAITNHLHIRISNKSDAPHKYTFYVPGESSIQAILPLNPFPVSPGKVETAPLFISFPRKILSGGTKKITIEMRSEDGFRASQEVTLLGPER